MKGHFLIKIVSFLRLFTAAVDCSAIVEPQKCLNYYNDEGYLYRETISSYKDAIEYCESVRGKPPMPTEKSWLEFLGYISTQTADTYHGGCWIGVSITKLEDSTFQVLDSDGWELNDEQIKQIFNHSLDDLGVTVGEELCVTYFPHRMDNNTPAFELQWCIDGGPAARAACRCISDVEKYSTPTPAVTTSASTTMETQTSGTSNSSYKIGIPEGRAGDVIHNGVVPNEPSDTVTDSTAPLAAILGLLAACCMIATTYFLVKKKGWNVQQRLSRSMPYNRSRRSTNGSIYRQGREMSEISRGDSRPIHVYEEIIPRNSTAANPHRIALLSAGSSVTLPQLPPPDPPTASALEDFTIRPGDRTSRSIDDGYLQPSFRRRDAIPGDVRSPPPIDTNMFTFPPSKMRKTELLPPPGQGELKYASVETVQTLLDGEQPTDEEYLVDDAEAELAQQGSHQFGSLVVELPDEKSTPSVPECNRNSILNSYVPINGNFTKKASQTLYQDDNSSPVFLQTSEYQNEQFLKTTAKVAPVKPKRKGVSTKDADAETKTDDSVVYSRIPSVSREALYSKVKPREERQGQSNAVDRMSAAYTPMRSGTLQRNDSAGTEENNSFYSDFSDEETSVDQSSVTENMAHEYQKIPNCSNTFISRPQMLSTTNRDLENSTLVCYDIPQEENDHKA